MESANVGPGADCREFRAPMEETGIRRGERSGSKPESATDDALAPAILCRYCRSGVTDPSQRTAINGSHGHRRFNPEGVIFDIGCFREAPGCYPEGEPTLAHTWFPGYSWTYALCANCHCHLGWFYDAATGHGFAGLILDKLIEPA